MIRTYLNVILEFIGAASLTDDEFASITLSNTLDQVANYKALLVVLEARDQVSEMSTRLQNYFLAQGVEITPPASAASHIFVGAPLQ